jgi:adenine-specific DNA-methyltransferase
LLREIELAFSQLWGASQATVADFFCGMGAVSANFKRLGHKVIANDNLEFCATIAEAVLLNNGTPRFEKLRAESIIPNKKSLFDEASRYLATLDFLNALSPVQGFMYQNYAPEGTKALPTPRQYFTSDNASKIDAIRDKIAEWDTNGLLSSGERALLLADLIRATNKVANSAGTYGCFLKQWEARALRDIHLSPSRILASPYSHVVYREDAMVLAKRIEADVAYLDPPYTWRHYGAYYHILETIARWDRPQISGKTGLRPWDDSRSPFCDREGAKGALRELVQLLNVKFILMSYNSEGLIAHEEIQRILADKGSVSCLDIDFRRYKSNGGGNGAKQVTERLYLVKVN